MKIAIGSDHGGFRQKQRIVSMLSKQGCQIMDLGCHSEDSTDYPDYAKKVAQAVSKHTVDRGILLCGTGIGMAITANKFPGVRAAVCWNPQTASLASEHNNANVLCVSGRFLSAGMVSKIVKAWLTTPFAGGRHLRRIKKIHQMERTQAKDWELIMKTNKAIDHFRAKSGKKGRSFNSTKILRKIRETH